jgi:hypothetical protein
MKRLLCILCVAALLIGLLPTVTFAAANRSQSNYYSYADIVKRTYDMSYLATEPQAGEGGKQITSTDPTSRYNEETGKYENWGANGDMHGYVRFNPENGFRVLADLKGPGYLTHIETGQNWSGRLHIWIDGALVIDTAFIDFVWGDYFKEFDQLSFKSNYVNMSGFEDGYQGAVNCFVPITYNESCVVEIDCNSNSDFYYTVGYYDLEDGASVEPFAWPMSTENRNALKLANDMLSDTTVPYGGQQFENTIQPGQTATLYESAAPGAISATTLELNIPEEELDNKTSLTDWTLSMYWDGSTTPAVQMPVADFYGNSCGLYDNHFDSAGFGTDGNGVLYSKWYMPYNSVKITLENNSAQARTVKATFRTASLTEEEANALTRFHANWQRAVARGDDRAPDAQMLYVEGKGRFVGTSLHVYQIIDGIWWGEGDEKFYIDGEKYPTWFGTGSEDYFGYAWCGSQIFDFPYCGQPHNDGDPSDGNHQVQGHGDKVNYRLHILDNVCFQSSFDANIEKYWSEESDKYAATTYFYLTRESSANHTQAPITQEERQFNDDLLTGYTLFYPGIYLLGRQLASNTATEIGTQSMAGVCEGQYTWYGNAHLFWMPASRGKAAEFLLEIPQEGNYALQGSFTTATDYGIYQLSIDGEPVGGSIDLYGAVSQKNLTVGGVTLSAGAHILKIECVGKNLSSGSYGLGLNYLKFEACEKMTYEHSLPSSSLYTALTDVTGSAYPYLFDMTGYAYSKYTWQNNQELFWKPAVGDRAAFSIDISGKDTYCLEIGMTEAADFGIFELLMDGKSIGTMDTFQAGGVFGEVFRFYNLGLTVGTHTLSVVCTGKNAASANTLMGIDYIKLNTQTQVGAFYGSIGALQQAWRTDSTSAMQVQELGWFSLNMWYHNHQLYTSGTETQNFDISLPADGVYSLDVAYSTGSDYGKFPASDRRQFDWQRNQRLQCRRRGSECSY